LAPFPSHSTNVMFGPGLMSMVMWTTLGRAIQTLTGELLLSSSANHLCTHTTPRRRVPVRHKGLSLDMRRAACLVGLIVSVTACGATGGANNESAYGDGVRTSGTAQAPASPTPSGAGPAAPAAHSSSSSASGGPANSAANPAAEDLRFSGSLNGTITQSHDATCSIDSERNFHGSISGQVGAITVRLNIFPWGGGYSGPGTYGPTTKRPTQQSPTTSGGIEFVPSGDFTSPALNLSPPGGDSTSGTFTIDANQHSGTIDMDFIDPQGKKVHVSGSWTCSLN